MKRCEALLFIFGKNCSFIASHRFSHANFSFIFCFHYTPLEGPLDKYFLERKCDLILLVHTCGLKYYKKGGDKMSTSKLEYCSSSTYYYKSVSFAPSVLVDDLHHE